MKNRIEDVFLELIKNSKKSDRDIAKKLGLSQPTITRIRKKLEKNVIKTYTLIPTFPEIGINLVSFNFGRCESSKKQMETCLKLLKETYPQIALAASGEGMGKNCLVIAFHNIYKDYVDFITNIRTKCKSVKAFHESFLVSIPKDNFLDFSSPVKELIKRKK